jgi:hypothetical protein
LHRLATLVAIFRERYVLEGVEGGGANAPHPNIFSTQEYFLAANLKRGTYKKWKYFVTNYLGGVRREKN